MQHILGTLVGKAVRQTVRLRKGSGQALPGLIVEKLFPSYFVKMLQQLPEGVVVVTGTNGKTTTTKMIVELLTANGKRVLTNSSGSNMTRGINSSLIHQARLTGRLPFDMAVFELDEAYACQFAKLVKPRWVVALNVTRDQLDRFGEVDTAAAMIRETMAYASEGIVTNANDEHLLTAAHALKSKRLVLFGVADVLRRFFPSDTELVAVGNKQPGKSVACDAQLLNFAGQTATYSIEGVRYEAKLQLSGQHNFQNATAAIALIHVLLPTIAAETIIKQLECVAPAFGRGQIYNLPNGSTLRLVLVKNPSGFRQALASYLPTTAPIMIAINDNIADGRDVSWLWDVDFVSLHNHDIAYTSGKRAADMALRLSYDGCEVTAIESDMVVSFGAFCGLPSDKLVFATYTAMVWLHKVLEERMEKVI